jgi:hypothetical protein
MRYGGVGDCLHTFTPLYIHTFEVKSKLPHALAWRSPNKPRELADHPKTAAYCPRDA